MIDFDIPQEEQKRPVFLLVLCILTFINTGFSFLTGIFQLISGPISSEKLLDAKVEFAQQASQLKEVGMESFVGLIEKIEKITEASNKHHYLLYLTSIIIVLLGAYGAFLMLKGKKLGFHIYIIYCLLAAFQLYLFVSAQYIPTFLTITGLLFSILWIFLYSRNLKWMK